IMWTTPKDFNQLITFINFFSRPDPKSLSVVISTKLYGAINYAGKVIPLTTPQLYKYYLQYSMPFIYLSYYPVIIVHKTNFIPLGYDIFQIDINGSISKAERKKQEKTILSYIKNVKNIDNNGFIKRNSNNVDDVEQEIYNILKNYNTKTNKEEENTNNKGNQEQDKESSDTDSNMVNLSNYEDLVDGTQNNVVIDYQSNIVFSQESFGEIKVDKPLFKILYHNNQFLGFFYNFDNSTNLYVFKNDGKIINSVKFDGIFSDVRLSNNKIVASTYEGQIIIINPSNFSIEKKIKTDYVFQNADFYKNYLVATNIKYPSSLVFFSLDGNKLREEVLPFINISNLLIDGDNILLACYGGMVLKMNENEKKYFQTYQENVTALRVIDDNLLIGTYPKPYLYVIPNYRNNTGFNRPILYDGFDTNGYVEDIILFNNKVFLSYKGSKLSVFSIKKEELLGIINDRFQKTHNLNWEKNISVPNFYWFIPFVKSSEKFYIPYISNTFTVINFSNKSEKGHYISKVFDSGQQKYLYDFVIRAEGNYDLFIRWGNNPIVDQTWTKWINYKDINRFNYQYRYFQYKFIIYPGTTIHSIFGLFEKINYKPFFIIDSGKKVYNSNGSINVSLWDPNGDKLNVYLKYYDGKKWTEIDKKQVTTKKTDVNNPDFSTNVSLSISMLNNKKGKVNLKLTVDDLPLNPSNYFIQEQELQIFIDNSKPVVKKYTYVNNVLKILVEDDSFVEAFIKNEKDIIPMKLNKIEKNVYEYILNIQNLDKQTQVIVKDEAENTQELKIIL
ncbi:MAG: hypothetical protein N2169_06835, partial [bacterium]|nr:hypothetical protein [bacterium]